MRTLSRWPVSQSLTDSVEVKRTGRSATLTGGGSAPPITHDLPERTSSFALPAPELGVPALGAPAFGAAEPAVGDGKACPLLSPVVRVLPSLAVLPARSGNRLATPRPSATMWSAALSTGRLDIRVNIRPSFNLC